VKYEGIIFDMDGVILDSERYAEKIFEEIFKELGRQFTHEFFKKVLGVNEEAEDKILYDFFGNQEDVLYCRKKMNFLLDKGYREGKIALKKGAYELINYLKEKNIPFALATSSPRERVERCFNNTRFGANPFKYIVTGCEVENSKPAPDIFLKAAQLINCDIEKCLIIEDSFSGIEAAHAAKATTCMIIDILSPTEELLGKIDMIKEDLFEVKRMIENTFLTKKELAGYFDYTNLKPFATEDDLKKLCAEAEKMGCRMVAINSYPVRLCKEYLKDSEVLVGAAISFPLGQTTIEMKVQETVNAIRDGADEIDYVLNIGKVKEHNYDYIKEEMQRIVKVCRDNNVTVKVIFENCYLTDEEKIKLCHIAKEVKPDYIKTSTGFGSCGATLEDIRLMVKEVDGEVNVKAAGGIRDLKTALEFIEAGVKRIGTSAADKILKELEENN
jgi:deoxyribose-phosphate aldolase